MMTSLALAVALVAFEPQGTSPFDVDYVSDTTVKGAHFSLFLMHDIVGNSRDSGYICSESRPTARCAPADLSSMGDGSTISGFGRVGAGRHVPSDASADEFIGTAFGILVPLAHRADVTVNVSTGETKMLTVTGAL